MSKVKPAFYCDGPDFQHTDSDSVYVSQEREWPEQRAYYSEEQFTAERTAREAAEAKYGETAVKYSDAVDRLIVAEAECERLLSLLRLIDHYGLDAVHFDSGATVRDELRQLLASREDDGMKETPSDG